MVKMSRRKQQNPKSVVSDAGLSFKENTKSAENSDILAASSPRGSGTDKDNPGRSADESLDGDGADDRRRDAQSRSSCVSSSSSSSATSSINLVDDDEEEEEQEDGADLEPDEADILDVGDSDDEADAAPDDETVVPLPPLPRLRLNVTLASDPALQPFARDLKLAVAAAARPPDDRDRRTADGSLRCDRPRPPNVQVSDEDEAAATLLIDVRELVPPDNTSHISPSRRAALVAVAAAPVPPKPPQSGHPIAAFACDPCGIRFSSLSTLAAHQTYYCSHTRKDPAPDETTEADCGAAVAVSATTGLSLRSAAGFDVASIPPDGGAGGETREAGGRQAPPARSSAGRLYACSQCSYSADKKVSLNRHMRMHQTSPIGARGAVGASGATAGTVSSTDVEAALALAAECYCSDCDIRYSSVKTYRAHKQHYCSARHRDDSAPDPSLSSTIDHVASSVSRSQSPHDSNISNAFSLSPPSNSMQAIAPQPYLALPTNPIVIIPYALIRGASVLPGPMSSISPHNVPNPDQTCFILSNGLMQPIAHSLALPLMSPPLGRTAHPNNATPSPMSPMPSRPKSSASVASSTTTSRQTPSVAQQLNFETGSECSDSVHAVDLCDESNDKQLRPAALTTNPAAPLDLSVRHMPADLSARSRHRSTQPSTSSHIERLICAPSLPGSPLHSTQRTYTPSATASPALSSSSTAQSPAPSSLSAASPAPVSVGCLYGSSHQTYMLRQLLPTDMMQRLVDAGPPPPTVALRRSATTAAATRSRRSTVNSTTTPAASIIVKQGVSKCKECNIVFCKYENFVAHKKHYCSARHQQPSAGVQPEVDSTLIEVAERCADRSPIAVTIPKSVPMPAAAAGNMNSFQQVICAACGIKFTSLDNLNAHQMYYCPKRLEMQQQAAAGQAAAGQAGKASEVTSNKRGHQQQTGHYGHSNHHQYRCPLCDVVSPNAGDAKRHLDTHAGVKVFRCSICRYRGNTMRGMRTHIRMHFDRKTTSADLNEEDYITCVLEENGVEVVPPQVQQKLAAAAAAAAKVVATTTTATTAAVAMVHSCNECGYGSTFVGNVVKHTKLVHGPMGYDLLPTGSPLIGEGGESLLYGGSANTNNTFSVNFRAERVPERHVRHPQRQREADPVEIQAKRIKLEAVDDEMTSSSSTSTSASSHYKQQQQPIRRKSVVSVN